MDDGPAEVVPPTAARVAARAIALSLVSSRGLIEATPVRAGAELFRIRMVNWLDRIGIQDELEEDERSLIETEVGALSHQATIDASWRSEGMVVLAWALRSYRLPPYYEQCEPSEVANGMGFLDERSETPLVNPRLRDSKEIERWANSYLTLHWRLRQFHLENTSFDFADTISGCTWGPLTVDRLELIEGDLAIRGERIDRVPESLYSMALSIAHERHKAFNWLLGHDPVYSRVATNT